MSLIMAIIKEIESLRPRELFSYTKVARLTARHLPPIREIIQNFALIIAKELVASIDSNRHNANLGDKYSLYFNFLRDKIKEYDIKPRYTYNMDKKGCLISIISRLKRVFSRRIWEKKEVKDIKAGKHGVHITSSPSG
ncbi:hypothetical protein BU23DRAFT_574016 [Bimuria novae-zelandiae CBS 107.79]|uniref:Uncharacterized protein n=1 Tax=Bimuria novae-zelandiae CBS 107.79 TaxID=1447943 RepID=A0A6A5UNZ3_9PLEO|nr:hypothetical protein BU23DRAFT_574016 [Bimuria novae-zelandiae CBS 107.79]